MSIRQAIVELDLEARKFAQWLVDVQGQLPNVDPGDVLALLDAAQATPVMHESAKRLERVRALVMRTGLDPFGAGITFQNCVTAATRAILDTEPPPPVKPPEPVPLPPELVNAIGDGFSAFAHSLVSHHLTESDAPDEPDADTLAKEALDPKTRGLVLAAFESWLERELEAGDELDPDAWDPFPAEAFLQNVGQAFGVWLQSCIGHGHIESNPPEASARLLQLITEYERRGDGPDEVEA